MDAPFSFNRSVGIGSRRDRITGDSGALTGRELLRRSGVVRFLAKGLPDKRDGRRIRHSQRRLARTLLLLAGQGRREHNDATALRDDPALRLATGDRAGTAPLGKAGRLPSQPTLSRRVAAWSAKEGARGAARGVAAAGGVAAEGDGRVAAPGDAGHRHRQPAGRGPRGTAGQRLERLLSPARVSSDRGGGGGDGRHPGPAAARGAGPHGGRRAGVRPRGAGAGGAASVREGRRALRRRGLGCVEERGTRWRAPHLGLRVVLPGPVVVPPPAGRAGRRRAAGRTHSPLLLAADFDALRGRCPARTSWRCTANAARRRAIWGS